jgi:hypothetical protein
MTIQELADTPDGRKALSLEIQKQLNERWETEFYPLVYGVFQKDTKPTKEGKYVELRKRGSLGHHCDLESLKLKPIELACNPSVALPLQEGALEALFGERGAQRAFDSLSRQVLCECCKILNAAGYRPENTRDISGHKQYFEKFISRTAERYRDEIYADLTMSPITVLPADDPGNFSDDPEEFRPMRIGMIVYLEAALWARADEYTIYPTNDNTLDTIIKEWPQEVE